MQRLNFANQLRGIAALGVACSHLIGVFWAMRDVVAAATFSPPQPGAIPGMYALVSWTWLNLGPFGVGLFFLISGLVVPISLEKHTRTTFLAARLLRIYPTYVAALLLEMAVLYAASRYWGRPFSYGIWQIASNAMLIYDTVGQTSLDLVNWTLCVELKFYILVAVLAPQIRTGRVSAIFAVAILIVAANVWAHAGRAGTLLVETDSLLKVFSAESLYLLFMLIGVLFNFHLRRLLGGWGLAASIAVMSVLFVGCWKSSAIAAQYPIVTVNYFYALGIFAALYCVRGRIGRNLVLDYVASISFPLYVTHSLVGYSILKYLLLVWGVSYVPAFFVTLGCVALLATGLHVAIERPTMRMGRRLAKRTGPASVGWPGRPSTLTVS